MNVLLLALSDHCGFEYKLADFVTFRLQYWLLTLYLVSHLSADVSYLALVLNGQGLCFSNMICLWMFFVYFHVLSMLL